MKRAFYLLLAMAAASLGGGCQLYQHMHGPACQDGCGCPGGCGGACASCPNGQCANGQCGECDGHPDPYEILHLGQQGPSQRSGVLSWLGYHNGPGGPLAGAGDAQAAPGPSAGAVSYPYYTNRGPRDFLSPNPRGIGP